MGMINISTAIREMSDHLRTSTTKICINLVSHFIFDNVDQSKHWKWWQNWIPHTKISQKNGITCVCMPSGWKVMSDGSCGGHLGGHLEFLGLPKDLRLLLAWDVFWGCQGCRIHWEKNFIGRCTVYPSGCLTIGHLYYGSTYMSNLKKSRKKSPATFFGFCLIFSETDN